MASERRDPDGLTDLERIICDAVDKGLTNREAYRRARPDATASDSAAAHFVLRVRRRPHCVAYLKRLQAEALERHLDRKDRVIEALSLIAFADIGDVLAWGPEGPAVKRLDALPPAQRGAVAAVSVSVTATGRAFRVTMHDKLAALDKLCKLFGLYKHPGLARGKAQSHRGVACRIKKPFHMAYHTV